MRIISGDRGGFKLQAPKGSQTRPTLERVRESLFMILMPRLEGARVLDLFAGAGTLGLEALSRGASHATFVDLSQGSMDALKANIKKLGWNDRTKLIKADGLRYLSRPTIQQDPIEPFDLIFLDPPYGEQLGHKCLEKLAAQADEWLKPEGMLIAQVGKKDELAGSYGELRSTFERQYGDTRIEFFERE